MTCNPTRIEISNAAATVVEFTVTPDPGAVSLTFQVDALGIDETITLSAGVGSVTIAAQNQADFSIFDGTIQVGPGSAILVPVMVIESNVQQAVGVNIDGQDVTYCAAVGNDVPYISETSEALLGLESLSDWRTGLNIGAVGSLETLSDSYVGFVQQPSTSIEYYLDLDITPGITLTKLTLIAQAAAGNFELYKRQPSGDTQLLALAIPSTRTQNFLSPTPTLSIGDQMFFKFTSTGVSNFAFALQFTKVG